MAVTKEDQNTFILIGAILIICLIAIIAIFAGIWAIIREPVNQAIYEIGEFVRRSQVYDYNFQIPEAAFNNDNIAQEPNDSKPDVDYNFEIPQKPKTFEGAVLTQDQLRRIEKGENIPVPELKILINKLGINSPILQGNDSDSLLKQGFWLAPISNTLGEGQVLLFCHRTYFGISDPRSCWFLDNLGQGDEILIKVNGEDAKYKVLSNDEVEANNELIYRLDAKKDLIKIVTFTPRDTGTHRLEIIATRVE